MGIKIAYVKDIPNKFPLKGNLPIKMIFEQCQVGKVNPVFMTYVYRGSVGGSLTKEISNKTTSINEARKCLALLCSACESDGFKQDNRYGQQHDAFVIYAPADVAEEDGGWWSNEDGWVDIRGATIFTAKEKSELSLPNIGSDAFWLPADKDIIDSIISARIDAAEINSKL